MRAMAAAGTAAAEELARLAVDETGYGVYEDKIVKNITTRSSWRRRYCRCAPSACSGSTNQPHDGCRLADGHHCRRHSGHQPDLDRAVQMHGRREGRQRHRLRAASARRPLLHRAAEVMAEAAERAGAPRGLFPASPGHAGGDGRVDAPPRRALVMATGGAAMVRAAYSTASRRSLSAQATFPSIYIARSRTCAKPR